MSQAAAAGSAKSPGKTLHLGLWVIQVLLAVVFGMAAVMKLGTPYAELAENQPWARHTPEMLVKFIGIIELAGAIGVILPAATRVAPFLTPLAAAGFVVIMVLAGGLHASLGEPPIANLVLGVFAAFVAWGRFKKAPISPR
jgi:uncharacterized membrane protein YphA (DoxX/SURF4 family)